MLFVLVAGLLLPSAWAQDTGDAPSEAHPGPGTGEHPGGLFRSLDPAMQEERAEREVEVWDKYLTLSDEQKELIIEIMIDNQNDLIALIQGGTRPTPDMIEELNQAKAIAIFEILSDEQKQIMNYYYNDIIAEITETVRDGSFGGQRPQQP